ncbi:2-methylaconitate cis-trans isomerase PrpF family protein [Edwardsiella piscicida]|uniref:2-methylaconitate cis-trans isomerase PrpF family protein n=1 Tax=Edwardsiella piscicida TaxID=1263550 RepID=UPI000934C608|nr:PrpF domain-containing protein [Edwardsiella piscicida]EKS7813328.1 proline racemase family protein [Edwardsiella piscicida]WAM43200.1 proline racemase family protein [Edwardsiella piscicida]
MQTEVTALPVAIVRGGTSKGIFIMKNALPTDPTLRDRVILSVFGSPDLRQIDGLGGADPLTSKLAIIAPASRPDADVDYIFGQVSLSEAFIDYAGNCGNISAAVGAFAIQKGMIAADAPLTRVRIHMMNTGRVLIADVPVADGMPRVEGDCRIDGVPGSGARIEIDWADCGGESTGALLPSGAPCDTLEAGGRTYQVSIIDAGNVTVFIDAEALGLRGTETPAEIGGDAQRMALIEEIRAKAAQRIGLIDDWRAAAQRIPYAPFFSIVSPPRAHDTFNGKHIAAEQCDIVSRLVFMQAVHKAHPVTGTVALGAAARIPGTLVYQRMAPAAHAGDRLRIGHPSGVIVIDCAVERLGETYRLRKARVTRTARILLDGQFYLRNSLLAPTSDGR